VIVAFFAVMGLYLVRQFSKTKNVANKQKTKIMWVTNFNFAKNKK
jgi:hypothetical protein